MDERRVWIGSQAAYVAGQLHGEWFAPEDFDDAEEFEAAVRAMLDASPVPGEEHYLGDREGWALLDSSEYLSLAVIYETARLEAAAIDDLGDADVLKAAVETFGDHYVRDGLQSDSDWVRERYCGYFAHPGDYAEQFWQDCHGDDLGPLASYIDWERYERDMERDGDITIHDGHVFSNT